VQQRLEVQADDKPRLMVMKDSLAHDPDPQVRERHLPTDLATEFVRYQWAEPREGTNDKELPQDFGDHALDALRYLCMAAESPGSPCRPRRIRNVTYDLWAASSRHVADLYSDQHQLATKEFYR